jgi:hypothetical protein
MGALHDLTKHLPYVPEQIVLEQVTEKSLVEGPCGYDLDVDVVDAGTGHDTVLGTATGTGDPGNDDNYGVNEQSNFTGGSGNDVVWVDGFARGDGGSGNDIVFGCHARELLGGTGNDWLANMATGSSP